MSSIGEIRVGDHVKDIMNKKGKNQWQGIVVKIIEGTDVENHGCIYVWQLQREDHGADNCEHYCHYGWQKSLKIIKKACNHEF